nr:MAG TPA: hypothetical protein [Caudoviricetes sp.]
MRHPNKHQTRNHYPPSSRFTLTNAAILPNTKKPWPRQLGVNSLIPKSAIQSCATLCRINALARSNWLRKCSDLIWRWPRRLT